MRALTIGTAAREAGVGVETIRFYERQKLIGRPLKPQGAGVVKRHPELPPHIASTVNVTGSGPGWWCSSAE
jgi:MerR family copper efflux transcriptional regulator